MTLSSNNILSLVLTFLHTSNLLWRRMWCLNVIWYCVFFCVSYLVDRTDWMPSYSLKNETQLNAYLDGGPTPLGETDLILGNFVFLLDVPFKWGVLNENPLISFISSLLEDFFLRSLCGNLKFYKSEESWRILRSLIPEVMLSITSNLQLCQIQVKCLCLN